MGNKLKRFMINRNSFKFDGVYLLSIQNHYNLITKVKHFNTQNKNSNKYLISKRTCQLNIEL